jgi:hypothetical protein
MVLLPLSFVLLLIRLPSPLLLLMVGSGGVEFGSEFVFTGIELLA